MAVRNDFTAGEVLAAADLNDTFASKVDYALPVNAQTGTTYTFVAADAEKLTTASNAAAVTLTIPPASSVAWPDNTVLRVVNYGAGAVTINGGSGVTVTNTSSTISQYGAAVAIRTGSDAWTVVPFGGGDVPSATVSSPAATGQYTDGGGQTWDYYTFTSSGTLTVDSAGFADVLVIGGGGGGGSGFGGGGGAGGYLSATDVYLDATSHTVTVGAGGASVTRERGYNGITSRVGPFYGVGGGGGGGSYQGSSATSGMSAGTSGGSGGGRGYFAGSVGAGTSGQGNDGGSVMGGGGGAGGAGSNGSGQTTGGNGGSGVANSITGSSVTYAGGGGGAGDTSGGTGGSGGGGAGSPTGTGTSGSTNTGGGGGAHGYVSGSAIASGAGGSGIVIVRVKV